jgi:hypothetical protein
MFTKRQYEIPKTYPAYVTFGLDGQNSTELSVLDQDSYAAFARNVGSLDAGKVMARKIELGKDEKGNDVPFAANDFAQSLRDGADFRGELQNDGDATTCGLCLSGFQPKVIPFSNADGSKGQGGNFLILKAAQIESLVAKLGELGTKVSAIAASTTASIMGSESTSKAVALPVCPKCRENRKRQGFMERFYSQATVKMTLPTVDQKITVAANRSAISDALGGRQMRPQQHATNSGPAFHRRDERRPEKPKVNWNNTGVMLETATAAAFTAAGYSTPGEVLALTEEEMCEKGLAHAGSVKPIRFVLQRSLEGRTVVGEAKSAAPGARPQVGGKKPAPRKRNIDVTPDRAARGGSVKLQNAF